MKVIKRDGRKVSFDRTKIVNAVLAAFKSVDGDTSDYAIAKASNIADYIEETCEKANKDFTINEIQTMVQHGLMSTKRKDVAEAYILFRDKRDRARQRKSKLFSKVRNRISASNVLNDNANMDEYSFGGREGQAASELFEEIAFDELVSQNFVDNHNNNRNYIHDRSSYAVGKHNCLSIPFDKLLEEGFITRQTDVRPANSINTALQLVAVISQLQSLQQFGGVSATHLDWTMVPYVRKSFTKHMINGMKYCENKSEYKLNRFLTWLEHEGDGTLHFDNEEFKELHPEAWQYAMDMTEKECQQAVEGMYHNLNTLQSRSGNQLPFTSINYGTCTLPEGRMVTKALLEGCIKGVGKYHKTSIFPCGIFQCMKGVNRQEGDPNYDLFKLAIKSTAQRLYPNYANVDWSGNEGYDKNDPKTYFSTMGLA